MHDMYYLEVSELPVLNSRSQKEFDNILLEYIEKFKTVTNNKDVIANLIATAIDYPIAYVKETINSYVRSRLLTSKLEPLINNEAFVREKVYIQGYKTVRLIYDRKNNIIKPLDEIEINEYKQKIENNEVELDNDDYFNIYSYLFYYNDFFDKFTKEKDKYLMSLTVKKIEKSKYKFFFKEKIKFYPLTVLSEKQVSSIKKYSNYKRELGHYTENYQFLNEIKLGKGYYQYNLASNRSTYSQICDITIEELLDIAKESIFIITTNIDSGYETKAYKKINDIRNKNAIDNNENKNIYIRTIEGFDNNVDVIKVDQNKNYYSQIFCNMIHSKIIIVDNFFVALGSGNWFTSSRDKWEDSLVIFPCENAIKKYCPIYDSRGDYYNIFANSINNKNDLRDLFDLYWIMKKDLMEDMNNRNYSNDNKNVYDEILIRKIEKMIESKIKSDFDIIVDFLIKVKKDEINYNEIYDYLILSEQIDKDDKEKLKNSLSSRGEV